MKPNEVTISGELVAADYRLALTPTTAPPPVHPAYRADRHPALVYLASLSRGSRRTVRQALGVIAGLLTGGRADLDGLPWHRLQYAHSTAVRSALAEHYAPATANKMLWALSGWAGVGTTLNTGGGDDGT